MSRLVESFAPKCRSAAGVLVLGTKPFQAASVSVLRCPLNLKRNSTSNPGSVNALLTRCGS